MQILGCGMHQFSGLRFRNTYLFKYQLPEGPKFIFRALNSGVVYILKIGVPIFVYENSQKCLEVNKLQT